MKLNYNYLITFKKKKLLMVVGGKVQWREVFNYHGLGYLSNIEIFIILVIQNSIYCETLSKNVLDTSKTGYFSFFLKLKKGNMTFAT